MSESEHRRFDTWLAAELRRPVAFKADGPQRVMASVLSVAGAHRATRRVARARNVAPSTAFAFAACVIGIIAFRMATMLAPSTNVDRFSGDAGLRDTISAFRDSMNGTARLVAVAVIAPAAARIAVVHDFHGWDLRIAPASPSAEQPSRTAALHIAPGLRLSPVSHDVADSGQAGSTSDSLPEQR